MEHPVFSLSTKPDMRPRRYERNGNWIDISPSRYGLATVHDRDVLIYCISQCMAALNDGRKVQRTMRFKAYDLLVATNRQTSGRGYELLRDALRRLQGTQIETNLRQGGKEYFKAFGLIDSAEIVREMRTSLVSVRNADHISAKHDCMQECMHLTRVACFTTSVLGALHQSMLA